MASCIIDARSLRCILWNLQFRVSRSAMRLSQPYREPVSETNESSSTTMSRSTISSRIHMRSAISYPAPKKSIEYQPSRIFRADSMIVTWKSVLYEPICERFSGYTCSRYENIFIFHSVFCSEGYTIEDMNMVEFVLYNTDNFIIVFLSIPPVYHP